MSSNPTTSAKVAASSGPAAERRGGVDGARDEGIRPFAVVEELLDETLAVFQPHTADRLTREDAQEIVEDVASFLTLLAQWDQEARAAAVASEPPLAGVG